MCEYKEIRCIKKMKDDYKNIFNDMVNEYAEKLSEKAILDDSVFTLHNFDNHCFNIYKIISNVLFDEEIIYDEKFGMTQKEWLILNLAVLFHDIGMSEALDVRRGNHAVKSGEYIRNEYDTFGRPLRNKTNLTENEIKALIAIVTAHSDVKGDGSSGNNGLKSSKLVDYEAKDGKKIRSKFLAGILRLADELDVSSERLGNGDLEQQLKNGQSKLEQLKKNASTGMEKEEIRKWESYVESLKHWENLHLISNIQRSGNGEVIELLVDDEYVERRLDEGCTERAIVIKLIDINSKIKKELEEAVEICFSELPFKNLVSVRKVRPISQNQNIQKMIDTKLGVLSLEKNNNQTLISESQESTICSSMPRVIDTELEKVINKEVQKRTLIKFGHYLLNKNYCARDWIDTKEIVETGKLLNNIVAAIVEDIKSRIHNNNYTVVGVDLIGTLLASRVAFALQKPLSYIVPKRDENYNADQEIQLGIENGTDVILITDVIVSYSTINNAVRKHALEERLDSVYTIFFRYSDKIKIEDTYLGNTFSINNTFGAELFEKKKCIYSKNKCIAQNQKMNEEKQNDESD